MERITERQLQAVCDGLNRLTANPQEAWTKDESGKLRSNIGCFHLDMAYSGYALCQMVNNGGGVRNLFSGHYSKRELFERTHAYQAGIRDQKEVQG